MLGRNVRFSETVMPRKTELAERLSAASPWLVCVIICVGAAVRLAHLPFSIDDTRSGGLFLAFAREIAGNYYLLPATIPHYTDGGLPFVYPPLSFYIEAVLAYGVGVPEHIVVHALPPIIAVLSLSFFHVLTGVMRLRLEARLLALFIFAVSWAAFEHQVETGGLAEAAGTLTLIWLATAFAKVRAVPDTLNHWHVLVGVALGMCIMASPGSAYASIILAMIFSAWHVATTRNFRAILVVAIVCLLVSLPYSLPVLLHHGPDIIIGPLAGQHEGNWLLGPLTRLLSFSVLWSPEQAFAAKIAVVAGMAHETLKRRWWIGVLLIVCLLIPREGAWMASIPASTLAGVGVVWLVRMWLDPLLSAGRRMEAIAPVVLALVALVVLGISAAGYKVYQEATTGSRTPDGFRGALAASTSVLPADAKVLTLVDSEDWSPFLMQRTVLNMPYGAEWQPTELIAIEDFQRAARSCASLACVHSVAAANFGYEELYVVTGKDRLLELCVTPRECDNFEVVLETGNSVVGVLRTDSQ